MLLQILVCVPFVERLGYQSSSMGITDWTNVEQGAEQMAGAAYDAYARVICISVLWG